MSSSQSESTATAPMETSADQPGDGSLWLDLLVILGVLVFAGLLGSVAIRNSEIWQHMATGRAIATGNYKFGIDPYCFTTTEVPWINPSWLFDLGVYWAYSIGGGTGVVVMRAALLVILAAVLLAIKRKGSGWTLPAIGVVLALIASNARLPAFQPTISSFLDLALLLLVLNSNCNCGKPWVRPLLVGLIQVHWVNHDGWFLLGPIVVALWTVGSLFMPRDENQPSFANQLVVLAVSIFACLLNPHLHKIFVLPDELIPSFWDSSISSDPYFSGYIAAPFDGTYLQRVGPGPFTALYVLLALGVASFAINARNLHVPRLLMWLALAAGACWRVRMVPFFAIGATPLMILNLQDAFARMNSSNLRSWRPLGALAALILVVAAGFAAWPGWLGPRHNDPQRAARVKPILEVDRGLQIIGEQVNDWSKSRLSADDRSYSPTTDIVHYLSWHAPKAKSFLDNRWRLFGHVVGDFVKARGVLNRLGDGQPVKTTDLNETLDQHKVTYVVLNGNERREDVGAARALWTDPASWPMWTLAGRATVFGRGAKNKSGFDAARIAFEPQAAAPLPVFPADKGDEPTFWDIYRRGIPARSFELEQALAWLEFGNIANALDSRDNVAAQIWGVVASAAIGTANTLGVTPLEPLSFLQLTAFGIPANRIFGHQDREANSAAGFVLALRNARLAQFKYFDDPIVYFALASAQQPLLMPESLQQMRIGTAWTQLLARLPMAQAQGRFYPDAAFSAANELFKWHAQFRHRDLAANAARECLKWIPLATGTFPDEKARDQTRQFFSKQLDDLEADLKRRRETFELRLANQPLPVRFQAAMQLEIPGEAIAEFRRVANAGADAKISMDDAARFVDVLIRTGNAEEARAVLLSPQFNPISVIEPRLQSEFRQLLVRACAAVGDLARAREELPQLLNDIRKSRNQSIAQAQILAGEIVTGLNGQSPPWLNLMMMVPSMASSFAPIQIMTIQEADFAVWAGFLALEEGDTRAAKRAFEELLTPGPVRQRTPAHNIAEMYRNLLSRYEQ